MFEVSPTLAVTLFALATVGLLLVFWRIDRNRYRNTNQQQVLNTSETLSGARRRALEELFEKVEVQSNSLFMGAMSHVAEESTNLLASLANSIGSGSSGVSNNNGSGGDGGSGGSGGAQSTQSPSAPPSLRTATTQSARPPATVQGLFRSASNTTSPASGGEDPEVYIKAIEAISQLYHKRTQQAGDEKRPMVG